MCAVQHPNELNTTTQSSYTTYTKKKKKNNSKSTAKVYMNERNHIVKCESESLYLCMHNDFVYLLVYDGAISHIGTKQQRTIISG